MADVAGIVDGLVAEGDDLDRIVVRLEPEQWLSATPAPGWTVAHQIAHLRWTDRASVKAATDPAAFQKILAQAESQPSLVDVDAANGAQEKPAELLRTWRESRQNIAEVLFGDQARRETPVVRAPDERRIDGNGAPDGNVGARARRRRWSRSRADANRPPQKRRSHCLPRKGFRVYD